MSENFEVPHNTEALKHYKRKTLMEHMVGPTGSIIFHVLIVFAAIKLMVFTAKEKAPEIEVMLTNPETVELEDFNKELEKIEELQDMTDVVTPPDVNVDMEQPPEVDTDVGPAEDVSTDLSALNVMNDVQSPLVMKGLYAGRSSGGRASALGAYGGKWGAYTEASVIKALEWLKNHQEPDGSWKPNPPAMTGLALLAFLAHGETTASEKYGPTVEKAIRYLVSVQKEDGSFMPISQPGVYGHAIATYAICEAYGLTRIPSLKPVMEKAAALIVKGQQPGGGWDYGYKKEARNDLSVVGWQVQALKSAYIAGAETPGLHEAIEKAIVSVKAFQHPENGLFGYSMEGGGKPGGFKPSMTGVGILCMQLTGHGEEKEAKLGTQAMKTFDCDWAKPIAWPMYAWYYITQAKFHEGGGDWTAWNNDFAREYTKNQNEDGSWLSPAEREERNQGPVYATALAALTLQVYYRFLPTYKPIKIEAPIEDKSAEEVSVEII